MTTMLMQAPSSWPFLSSHVVPSNLMPSGRHYALNSDGQFYARPEDVSVLLGFGFFPVGVIQGLAGGGDVTMCLDGTGNLSAKGGGGSSSLVLTLSLTANDINHLFTTPKQLVAAPGAGKVIVPRAFFFAIKVGTIATGGISSNASNLIPYFDGILTATSDGLGLDQGCFESLVDSAVMVPSFWGAVGYPAASPPTYIPNSITANKALMLSNLSGNYGDYGAIATSNVHTGGALYTPGDTGKVGQLFTIGNGNAVYTVLTVDGGGAVLTYALNNPAGSGFPVQDDIQTHVTTGGGNGNFTIDVTAITPGNSIGTVTVFYQICDLP